MSRNSPSRLVVAAVVIAGVLILAAAVYRDAAWQHLRQLFELISDIQRIQTFIQDSGKAAPLVFMGIQLLQVIIAPIPGEVTGFIGGFLFGAVAGFFYSSIALTAGSVINFCIGRWLGRDFVARHVPAHHLARFDSLFHDRGLIVVFVLFLFPGFPKDYFCLFLGLTALPLRLLILMAAVGRLPGTLMLSLQGAAVFHGDYRIIAVVALVSLAVAALAYRYRAPLVGWAERYQRR